MLKLTVDKIGKSLFDFEKGQIAKIKFCTYGRWNVWPLIKFSMYYSIFAGISNTCPSANRTSIIVFFKAYIRSVAEVFKISFKGRGKYIVFPLDIEKLMKNDKGEYVNVTIDPLVSLIGRESCIYIERPFNGCFKTKSQYQYDLNEDGIRFLIAALSRIIAFFHAKPAVLGNLSIELNKYYKSKFNFIAQSYSKTVERAYYQFIAEYWVYLFLFYLWGPKVVITTDQFATGKAAAAKRLKIKLFELQHGFIERYKPDYILSKKMLEIKEQIPIPDSLLLYGEFYKEILLKGGFWRSKEISSIGNYRLSILRTFNIPISQSCNLLFPTQWTTFERSKIILDILASSFLSCSVILIIKLHPAEHPINVKWYKAFSRKNENVKLASQEDDIYQLMYDSNLIIGFDSASLLESIALNKPVLSITNTEFGTGILDCIDPFLVKKYIGSSIKQVNTKEEFKSLLNKFINNQDFRKSWEQEVLSRSPNIYETNYFGKINEIFKYQ